MSDKAISWLLIVVIMCVAFLIAAIVLIWIESRYWRQRGYGFFESFGKALESLDPPRS